MQNPDNPRFAPQFVLWLRWLRVQWQNTFAITMAGRGFDARISTEFANSLPDSVCLLWKLHRGLPDRGARLQTRVRQT